MNFRRETGDLAVSSLDAISVGLPRKFEAVEAEAGLQRAVELEPNNGDVSAWRIM